jgi:5-amino-6-(5-phosphoribosylamino)uracil reductase
VGGPAGRIATGPAGEHLRRMELADILHEDDTLLLRYRRIRGDTPIE